MSATYKMTLSIIAKETGPVSAGYPPHLMAPGQPLMDLGFMLQPKLTATHTFLDAPALDVLLVPGGFGTVALQQSNDKAIQTFLRNRFASLEYLLSVCTGSGILASSGLLDGHRATTNKNSWESVTSQGPNVTWVPSARWTQDGKIWTSSGVASGIDMMYAFLKHLYGENDPVLTRTMNGIEYAPHTDPNWDPFSIVHDVPGHTNGSLESCVRPVGTDAAA
ncbi:class I glutamine amidotransferase-like protein [Parathielavia appendiculata]|uniref:Class I glutamine amidotransferase-like protein n=1 Tax=Parathielavia appendiculata TaxID=2587402 RepID=A0AAN6UAD2_9PEZI|nr:class I glutamine amidotransferase-like protein [Parathielavia appendiculata]